MGTNLHSVWDYYILGSDAALHAAAPYADRLDALPWPPIGRGRLDRRRWPGPANPAAWSMRAAPVSGRQHKLDDAYLDAMRPLAEQRVRQAAWRLARLLNETLGD